MRAVASAMVFSAILGMVPPLQAQTGGKVHPSLEGKNCAACHASVLGKPHMHSPAKEQQCDSCHTVPQSGGQASLTDKPESLCYMCHEQDKLAAGNVHGPVAVGGCLVCHDPHGGTTKYLVRVEGAELCLGCHEDMKARVAAAAFRHKPVESDCTACHSPHSSPQKFLVKKAGPDLCASCHQSVMKQVGAAVKHKAATDGRACLGCHDPHVAAHRPQLRADGVTTCLSCHDRIIESGSLRLADLKTLLAENKDHHGPIREKDCAGCHSPHGGEHFRLLKEDYPKEFYAPFKAENFALCFECHDSALPRDERTTTLTDFRDGDRNLHFVHVNKTPKGRTCRACHETHASKLPNHIRESVPFGKWSLPISFTKNANGGTCAPGCHAVFSYDRTKAINRAAR